MSRPPAPDARRVPVPLTSVARSALLTTLQALAAAALAVVAGLSFWSLLPAAFGWSSSVVISGSMAPQLNVGDVAVTSPVDPALLAPGHVVLFPDPADPARQVLHRVVEVTADGRLVTRGDANQSADSATLDPADVTAVGRLRVPFVGLPRLWWQEGAFVPLAGLGALLVLGIVGTANGAQPVEREPGTRTVRRTARAPRHRAAGLPRHAAGRPRHHESEPSTAQPGRVLAGAATAVVVAVALQTGSPTDAYAAFTAASPTASGTFGAGTVQLSDDATGAIIQTSGLLPGDSGSACLTATYSGSLAADVTIRAASSTGTLAPYVQITIEEGTGTGAAPSCTGFSGTQTFSGRLDTLLASTGVGTWAPTTSGQTRMYRVTYQLHGDRAAEGASAGFSLELEARST